MVALQRSPNALRAASVFYQSVNDIDVYIEDTAFGYKKIFLVLIQRLLSGRGGVSQVFPLGGRLKVIEEAKKHERTGGRPSVFIVDGDLFLLSGEREVVPQEVVVLPRYCIENLILDPNAIVDVLDDEDSESRHEELSARLGFDAWRLEMEECFRELFVLFAISHHLELGIKSVSVGYQEFIDRNGTQKIDENRVQDFLNNFKLEIFNKISVEEYERVRLLVEGNIDEVKCFASTYISGKDFLMPLLFLKMKKVVRIKSDNLNLKIRLAKKCKIDDLNDLGLKLSERLAEKV